MAAAFRARGRGSGSPSSSSLSEGASAGSGGGMLGHRRGVVPPVSKRQAVGEPGTCSPLKRQDLECSSDDDEEDHRKAALPSHSSSAASALICPAPDVAVGTRRLDSKGRRDAPKAAVIGDPRGCGGPQAGRATALAGNDLGAAAAVSSTSRGATSAGGAEDMGDGGRGDDVGRSGCLAVSDILLEHYPETRMALEALRSSKQGTQAGWGVGQQEGGSLRERRTALVLAVQCPWNIFIHYSDKNGTCNA